MGIYSKALRHIDMKDVKKKHQQKLIEQKIKEEKEQEEKEFISSVMESKRYDWRAKLNEGMTSSGMFFTTLPATGDVDLSVASLDTSGFEASADVSFNSGTNSGFTGGFSSGDGIINLGGEGDYSTGVVSNTTDLSAFDSINITAIAGNNSNGGMVPTRSLQVAFFTDTDVSDLIDVISPSTNSFTNVNINIPQQFRTKDVGIILYSNTSDGHGYHGRHFRSQTIPIPGLNHTTISNLFPESLAIYGDNYAGANMISSYLRSNQNTQQDFYNLGYFFWFNSMVQRYGWFDNVGTQEDPELVYRTWPAAPISGATTEDNITPADYRYVGQTIYNFYKRTQLYGISNVSFRRRTPMNVFVSLDSPEASAFIRTDPIMSNLSPQERLQRLKDMLEASDEYVMKILGVDFPGTGAVPPGEYDPFEQPPAGEAGDTPGVEIAQLSPADYDMERATDQMLLKGLQRGDYGTGPDIDRQIKNLQKNLQQGTPGGLPQASSGQDTQIAQNWPSIRDAKPSQTTPIAPVWSPGEPLHPGGRPYQAPPASGSPVKLAQDDDKKKKQQSVVASYEPEGQVISEKRKLKSPQELLNKIPGYYDGKPAPLGFPETPPPEMVNGMHPDLVDGKNVANRFNRLDPISANAMPLTGNPHIDKKVKAARKKPK